MAELVGKIEGVTLGNRSTGFHVLKIRIEKPAEDEPISCAVRGTFPGLSFGVGIKAKFQGDWTEHPVYGKQFNASHCELAAEKGRNGIVSYLQTNVPSIGPITAAKLYDALGDGLVETLENDPDKIRALSFLNRAQVEAILSEWATSKESRTIAIFLSDLGLSANQVRSVYTKYAGKTKDKVLADPYCLYQCPGVGFVSADNAARRLGVGIDDLRRVRAMVLFSMAELSQSEGHMYCSSDQILTYGRKMFRRHGLEPFSHGEYISDSHYYKVLEELKSSEDVVSLQDRIYLAVNWDHEYTAAECVSEVLLQPARDMGDLDGALLEFEAARGVKLSDEQKQAFLMLGQSRICVVSGLPGTGKTLLVSAFVHLFERANLDYHLLSPTGIAAKRLSQVTGKSASTIHRALRYQKDGSWEFNVGNKFFTDAVIVDETSMVDAATFFHLITALPETTIMIFVGDRNELPSVGAGYVLNSLMHSSVPHVALTRIYRQAKQSDIISVAHAILRGEPVSTEFDRKSEFVFMKFKKEEVLDEMCKMATLMKQRESNFQVIAPMYDGDLGVNMLNRRLRDVLNPDYVTGRAQKLKAGDVDFYEGDRVMVIKNDYDRMVYNGDVGKIIRISPKNDQVDVKIFDWFDQESSVPTYVDKIFTYKLEEARHTLKVAYACTAHKVQGQEFDYVLLPMTMQYGIMLYRNLIYTAITRAKKKVFIFGDPNAFTYSIENDRETIRNSRLADLIEECVHPEAPAKSEPRLMSSVREIDLDFELEGA